MSFLLNPLRRSLHGNFGTAHVFIQTNSGRRTLAGLQGIVFLGYRAVLEWRSGMTRVDPFRPARLGWVHAPARRDSSTWRTRNSKCRELAFIAAEAGPAEN